MSPKAAITVLGAPDDVEREWRASGSPDATFKKAPGDRGTEIYVEVDDGSKALAKAKDELRRFKQRFETGEITRSDGTPEGEAAERKVKQRPAQPAGAR